MYSRIEISALKPGDVLLYHYTGWIGRAIRKFDGTDYNHAALYDDDGDVIEALAEGVVKRNIQKSAARSKYITVFRLKDAPGDMQPVVDVAKSYLGHRYAGAQLILLAAICLFRKIKMNRIVARIAETALEKAANLLMSRYGVNSRESLTCSELVYRSYNEAAGDNYKITVLRESGNVASQGSERFLYEKGCLFERLYADPGRTRLYTMPDVPVQPKIREDSTCEKLVGQIDDYQEETLNEATVARLRAATVSLLDAVFQTRKKQPGIVVDAVTVYSVLEKYGADFSDFVTPGDLFKSPSLQPVGDICK